MDGELLFRAVFALIFATMLIVSGIYRRKARAEGGTIPRRAEGRLALLLRLCLAVPLLLVILTYVFAPVWLEWATLSLPDWVRWTAAFAGFACLPLIVWVFRNIGKNISETVLTKQTHQLVTTGPYRWIRHPLYTFALLALFALGALADNALLLGLALVSVVTFRFLVIPKEEANLIKAFGPAYEAYRRTTGAMLPRLRP